MAILIFTCVTALATLVYGAATYGLWHETRQDRKQREQQFRDEVAARKLAELHSAFYETWGNWNGHKARSGASIVDSSQAGKVFEALIRLEGLLRLSGYCNEANNFGIAIRTMDHVDKRLSEVGVALGLVPSEYPIPQDIRHP
jgi:hypothetical protein